jgi:hypothetical protein
LLTNAPYIFHLEQFRTSDILARASFKDDILYSVKKAMEKRATKC